MAPLLAYGSCDCCAYGSMTSLCTTFGPGRAARRPREPPAASGCGRRPAVALLCLLAVPGARAGLLIALLAWLAVLLLARLLPLLLAVAAGAAALLLPLAAVAVAGLLSVARLLAGLTGLTALALLLLLPVAALPARLALLPAVALLALLTVRALLLLAVAPVLAGLLLPGLLLPAVRRILLVRIRRLRIGPPAAPPVRRVAPVSPIAVAHQLPSSSWTIRPGGRPDIRSASSAFCKITTAAAWSTTDLPFLALTPEARRPWVAVTVERRSSTSRTGRPGPRRRVRSRT